MQNVAGQDAARGEFVSRHIDDILGAKKYSKETRVEDCLDAMDYLVEAFAERCVSEQITISVIISLEVVDHLSMVPPEMSALSQASNERQPPEIYFSHRAVYSDGILEGEEYRKTVFIKTRLSEVFDGRRLFSFYKCQRNKYSIDNNIPEYQRCIIRVFDPSGRSLWGW